jgi:hypothetical protein
MTTTTTNPEINSLKYVMAKWSEILAIENKMNEYKDSQAGIYFDVQKELNKKLVEFIRLNFSYLSSRQLLKLCALVSAHRPVQPFSFLVSCSNLI